MHLGKVDALGTCKELEASLGGGVHTLDEVFARYAASALDSGGSVRDVSAERATAQRLGYPNPMTAAFTYPVTGFVEKTFVIAEFELRKLRHDFTELVTRALQPALWLLIFGQVFSRSGPMHTGNVPYVDFIAPGILAQSVLFVAIFCGINVIWERDLGIVRKFLASPTRRAALVLGKGFSAGICTLSQAMVVCGLALLLGVKLTWSPLALLSVLVTVVLAATLFSTFSLIIACIVKTRERFLGVGQVLHAVVLCKQRDLPHLHDARLAAGDLPSEPTDPCGRCPADVHADRQPEHLQPG
jgi:ABC-2 type transport system permease protein